MMQQIEKYIDKFPVHVDRTHSFIIFSSKIMNYQIINNRPACSVVGKRARAAHVILCVGTGSSLAAATDFYVASTHRARHPGRFKWVTAQ